MAEEKAKTTKEKKVNAVKEWEGKSVAELKVILQKLALDIKTGKEKNTSLQKKLRKYIAQTITKLNIK